MGKCLHRKLPFANERAAAISLISPSSHRAKSMPQRWRLLYCRFGSIHAEHLSQSAVVVRSASHNYKRSCERDKKTREREHLRGFALLGLRSLRKSARHDYPIYVHLLTKQNRQEHGGKDPKQCTEADSRVESTKRMDNVNEQAHSQGSPLKSVHSIPKRPIE